MRAAAAEKRRAFASGVGGRQTVGVDHRHAAFFGLDHGNALVHAARGVCVNAKFFQSFGDGFGDDGGRQIGLRAQQPIAARVGLAPLAAALVVGRFVKLAQHVGAHIAAPVVQLLFELVLNDLALFFDHQNLLQTFCKVAGDGGLQWPHHVDFVQANP